MQVELQRMNAENQRFRDVLSQVTNNYNALQMHLAALMQHQQQQQNHGTEEVRSLLIFYSACISSMHKIANLVMFFQ